MAVITISRQYGSGAREIAERLCNILGYRYFDKNLMVRVAAEVGLSEDEIIDFSEENYKVRTFMDRLLGRAKPTSMAGSGALKVESLDEAQCVNLVKDTILAAYNQDNVVIIGRGGQAILREKPGVLHVRLEAPLGARTLRVKERENISMEEASTLVKEKESAAAAYLLHFFDIEWEHPMLYHLILNTGRWDLDAATAIIVNALTYLRSTKLS
ncbi:MAG: cytidylate kinase-like family protein [Anaerolineae bacterium]|nr:cytidylate kinase-like family protein [Anaerolineae bacterium]